MINPSQNLEFEKHIIIVDYFYFVKNLLDFFITNKFYYSARPLLHLIEGELTTDRKDSR